MPKKKQEIIKLELIQSKIYTIRNHKVMLDKDLAELYEVTTGNLNKAVKRNIKRFPKTFMFQLTKEEFNNLKFHFGTSSWGGTHKLPSAFTEHGALMLSSILRSEKAVQVSVQIIEAFVQMHQILQDESKLKEQIKLLMSKVEKHDLLFEKSDKHDEQINNIFAAIQYLISENEKLKSALTKNKKPMGFKTK